MIYRIFIRDGNFIVGNYLEMSADRREVFNEPSTASIIIKNYIALRAFVL